MPKPEWLKIKVQSGGNLPEVQGMLSRLSLHTVCEEANCPNRMECFARRTATFMILGDRCTRNCTFCNVTKGAPVPVDADEPRHAAEGVRELGLKHVVITSVTRDDLPDGGAEHFAETIRRIRETTPDVTIEVLIPDFKGSLPAQQTVLEAGPDVLNHNILRPCRGFTRKCGPWPSTRVRWNCCAAPRSSASRACTQNPV
jgi:lipoic acid synthetase